MLAFKYDGLGRRVQKTFTEGSSTTVTNYVYDGSNPVADVDQNASVLARYTFTRDVDEPLAQLRSGITTYFSLDGLGSVTSLTSSTSGLANSYTYDSYGNLIASTGATANRFQFNAREFDSETGLYSYRARYYDSVTGRFLSEDPEGLSPDVNLYRYVHNNSINMIDPTGLATPGWHYDQTYNIAKKIFGPKCDLAARNIAYADMDADTNVNYVATFRFLTFRGPAWDSPGTHFPNRAMVGGGLAHAIGTCNQGDMGRALHSLQDYFFHYGITPGWHFVLPLWDQIIQSLNLHASPVPRVGAEASATADALQAFKDNCLCCN